MSSLFYRSMKNKKWKSKLTTTGSQIRTWKTGTYSTTHFSIPTQMCSFHPSTLFHDFQKNGYFKIKFSRNSFQMVLITITSEFNMKRKLVGAHIYILTHITYVSYKIKFEMKEKIWYCVCVDGHHFFFYFYIHIKFQYSRNLHDLKGICRNFY